MPNEAAQHPWSYKAKRSPWPGQTLDSRMPTAKAKVRAACSECDFMIKPGQRVGKMFATQSWVHLGCLVRHLKSQPDTVAS